MTCRSGASVRANDEQVDVRLIARDASADALGEIARGLERGIVTGRGQ
jgi:hypothetical protein